MNKKVFLIIVLILMTFILNAFYFSGKNDLNVPKVNYRDQNKKFVVFDGMMIKDKPSLSKFGLKNINIIYEDSLLDKGVINYNKISREINKVSRNNFPICLDIESWDLRDSKHKVNGKKYLEVFNHFKNKLPNRDIGYFGMMPYRDVYLYNQRSGANSLKRINYIAQWENLNNNIGFITKGNDIAFPAFYTRNKSLELWEWATKLQISNLKKTNPNLPVYGFIWPQYWNKEFLSQKDWAFVLETMYKYCDGIVIWCPPMNIDDRKPIRWNNSWGWWIETQKFIEKYKLG